MNAIHNTLAVTWKELQLIAKDRGALAVLFLLPLLVGSLMSFVNLRLAGEESPDILVHVTLANADGGPFGQRIVEALQQISQLEVETYADAGDAELPVALGQATAAILIPADLSKQIDAYEPTQIEMVVDPGEAQAASIVAGIMNKVVDEVAIWGEVQYGIRAVLDESSALGNMDEDTQRAMEAMNLGVVMTTLNEMRQNPLIAVVSQNLQGATVEGGWGQYFALLFPGLSVMFIFFIVGPVSSSLLTERADGTLRRLVASPLPRSAIIAGKMLAYTLLVCLQVIVLFSAAAGLFKMPLGRSPLGLVLLTLALGLTATSLGLLIAALASTPQQADSLGTIMGFVLAGVGGAIPFSATPLTRAGGFIGFVSKLTPHAHAVEGYYKLMGENASLIEVLPHFGILLAMGLAFFLIAVWRFRFE
ncbi:MAG: ABC transporter permease [Anaerolineales bacterium]|nr:ABC transporter permease [Anaerolineales bacterium]